MAGDLPFLLRLGFLCSQSWRPSLPTVCEHYLLRIFVSSYDFCRGTYPWTLPLIVKCNDDYRRYIPKSDMSLWRSGLPRLLIEVNSGRPPAGEGRPLDHIRLLLQGIAVVRFANGFVDHYKGSKTFVLVAIYMTYTAKAHCHIMYQKSSECSGQSRGNVRDPVCSAA
jgi:hypothetical protein